MLKFCFYVPPSHLEEVKAAVFEKGAGRIGNYDCCCWQAQGEGQFRPLENSQPFLGEQNKLRHEPEYKVEMLCAEELMADIMKAFRSSHPYEEPAFDVIKILDY